MTKEEKLIAIKNLRLAIDLAGDGGPAAFYSEEEDMMRNLLDEIEKTISGKNKEDKNIIECKYCHEVFSYTENDIIYRHTILCPYCDKILNI